MQHTQVEQRQKNRHGLLLVPRQHERKRQVIDAALEGIRSRARNLESRVGVVALSEVEQARQAANLAEVQLVEAVLSAGKSQNEAIIWHGFGELGVVVPSRTRAVAAANQEEVPNGARLHGIHHCAGHTQHGIVAKANRDLIASAILLVARSNVPRASQPVFQHMLNIYALDIRDALNRPPRLCNTDGDSLLFHTMTFRIQSADSAFEALATLAVGRSPKELLDDAEIADGGKLQSIG